MAQHDYILANQSGAAFRSDLNNGLAAIVSQNSGAAQPSTTYAYQWWADTTTGLLKIRNAANNAWITLFQLDGEWTTLALENGTAAAPSLYFKDSGTDTGLFSPGANQLAISTGGVQRLLADASGNLTASGGLTVANINGGPLAGTRNRIINGDMRIDQRGAVVTTNGAYTVDRWQLQFVTTGAVQCAQSSDFPTGFDNSLVFDVTTADTSIAAGEYGVLTQYIEGLNTSDLAWGTASAQTVTLSFWVKSTTTGTYCVSFRNSGNSRSYVATYSVASANTWEYKTITVSGDTSGTWLGTNVVGISIAFCFAVGSTFQTTAGAWQAGSFLGTSAQTNLLASTANEIRITGVQLEPGAVTTPFERRSYGQELALCQRYFISQGCNAVGHVQSGIGAENMTINLPVLMRSAPTISVSGSPSIFDGITGSNVITSIAVNNSVSSALRFRPTYSGGAAFTLSGACVVSFNGSITASSEL